MYVHVFSFLYFYSRSIKHVCGCVFILYFYSRPIKPRNKDPLIIISLIKAGQLQRWQCCAAAQGSAASAAAQLHWLRQ
jgi:hypothetical protein